MSFKRKVLLTVLISLLVSSGYFVFMRMVTDPEAMKPVKPEKIEDSMARIYENFLHKTKYSYETILESGTDYSNQERVFVELTKKMKSLEDYKSADYKFLQDKLEEEISKNRAAFESFYVKATKTTPEELEKLIAERNKQFDIVLEGN